MEQFLNIYLPIALILIGAILYAGLLYYHRHRDEIKAKMESPKALPKKAPVITYLTSVQLDFQTALRAALPAQYLIMANVPIEKLFDVSYRKDLQMQGQYADFVVFTPELSPVLIIDLFDMSIVNLDRVNKIKNVSKNVLRASGIPVLDYRCSDHYNLDELRRAIANLLNPLRVDKK